MKPLFTIHAGELLVANELERKNKFLVWLPSKDEGIDLLVTNHQLTRIKSIQVKFSKDYTSNSDLARFREKIGACGWWTINRKKLKNSKADFWVFVMYPLIKKNPYFLVIPTRKTVSFFQKLRPKGNTIQVYIWVVNYKGKELAFETRGLKKDQLNQMCEEGKVESKRVLSPYLNNWKLLGI